MPITYIRQAFLLLLLLAATSWFAHRVISQNSPLVGYAVITAGENSPVLVASALFSFRNAQGLLLSEAGIEAVEPISRGRIFVDRVAPGSDTGVALANASDQAVSHALTLRDAQGMEKGTTQRDLGQGEHTSLFVSQIFPDEAGPGFVGSLTFETLDPGQLAAVTIRQTSLPGGDVVFATLPVADLDSPVTTARQAAQTIIFPHLGRRIGSD